MTKTTKTKTKTVEEIMAANPCEDGQRERVQALPGAVLAHWCANTAAQAAAYAAKAADAAETYAVFDAAEAAADAAKYAGDDRSVTETKQLAKLVELLSEVHP